jgi:16S rRNA (cytosine1402-N4)-methyltransferase
MSEPIGLEGFPHYPVLYKEIIHALQPRRGGLYLDGTVGAGGHAQGILQASSPDGKLLGLDLDPQAIELAQQRLAPFGRRATLVQASFEEIPVQLAQLGWVSVDGLLLDLGVSSMQLDSPERGFSFNSDAQLDMRLDPRNLTRAEDLVNGLPEGELADILFRYGEEKRARQIARAIVQARPVENARQLAELVARVARPSQRRRKGTPRRSYRHPATRTFLALRIAVNHELEALETALPAATEALAPGGRLAVIAFHSLEDRIVKQFIRRESRDCICPPEQPACTCDHKALLKEITRRPLVPQPEEIKANPRSRSARLRVAEKIG